MIRFRVDDYPSTKPEEFYRHNLDNFKKFHEVMERYGAKYVLGVIPFHAKDEDLKWLGQQESIEIALHGVNHDERFPNEFRDYQTEDQIHDILCAEKARLELYTEKDVNSYIPPHNVVDKKTVKALVRAGFQQLHVGPETDEDVCLSAWCLGLPTYMYLPPFRYGRSDELLARGAVDDLWESQKGFVPGIEKATEFRVGLHWTWEHNIGLDHLDTFLTHLRGMI